MSIFALAALVVFIIAAILAFVTNTDVETILGLVSVGLACYVAASVAPWRVG